MGQHAASPPPNSDVKAIADRAAHVRGLALRAKTVTPSDRAKLFGGLLVTCANCHRQLDVQPFATPIK
jgi:hypothetical protein